MTGEILPRGKCNRGSPRRSVVGGRRPTLPIEGVGRRQGRNGVQVILQPLLWTLATASALGIWFGERIVVDLAPAAPAVHHIVGVPLVAPNRDWCGPAALAAVLQHHGERLRAADIAREIHLPDYRGALNLDLLLFARGRGYQAWAGVGTSQRLRQSIARDEPAICMVRSRGPLADRNHFVVVRGYDEGLGCWFVDAGNGREEVVSDADFDARWAECGRWMLAVQGPTGSPAPEVRHAAD